MVISYHCRILRSLLCSRRFIIRLRTKLCTILVSSHTCWFYLVIIIEDPLGEIPSENVVAQGHKGASKGRPAEDEDVLNRVTVDVSSGVFLSIFMY